MNSNKIDLFHERNKINNIYSYPQKNFKKKEKEFTGEQSDQGLSSMTKSNLTRSYVNKRKILAQPRRNYILKTGEI